MSEAREFHIHLGNDFLDDHVLEVVPTGNNAHQYIKVIEHSAYLSEKARADKAERKLAKALEQRNTLIINTPRSMMLGSAESEIKRLDAELGEG